MLKQPQHSPFLSHEPPAVFGKPWYWQRSSSTMESSRSLAQVILEMRDEIKNLEAEKAALRGERGQNPFGFAPEEQVPNPYGPVPVVQQRATAEENPYLRRNASAPALEGQYKENMVMTVRRYSIASNLTVGAIQKDSSDKVPRDGEDKSGSDSSGKTLQQEANHEKVSEIFGNSNREESGKLSNRRSFQEYMHKNRAKVKTVTFLLPVEDIYTNVPVLGKPLSDDHHSTLDSIAETDS